MFQACPNCGKAVKGLPGMAKHRRFCAAASPSESGSEAEGSAADAEDSDEPAEQEPVGVDGPMSALELSGSDSSGTGGSDSDNSARRARQARRRRRKYRRWQRRVRRGPTSLTERQRWHMRFMVEIYKGLGLHKEQGQVVLRFLRDLAPHVFSAITTETYVKEVQSLAHGMAAAELSVTQIPVPAEFKTCVPIMLHPRFDTVGAVVDMLMALAADDCIRNDQGELFAVNEGGAYYSEINDGTWYSEAVAANVAVHGPGSLTIPLLVWDDGLIITGMNGSQSAHPMVGACGLLTVAGLAKDSARHLLTFFQEPADVPPDVRTTAEYKDWVRARYAGVRERMIQEVNESNEDGGFDLYVPVLGQERRVIIEMLLLGDYPAQCKQLGVKEGWQGPEPCNRCHCPRDEMGCPDCSHQPPPAQSSGRTARLGCSGQRPCAGRTRAGRGGAG